MTAFNGVIQVYAASEEEGTNINAYNAQGTYLGSNVPGTVLNGIAAIAENYDNFVRVERITQSTGAVDISQYQTLE